MRGRFAAPSCLLAVFVSLIITLKLGFLPVAETGFLPESLLLARLGLFK
jgi:hypothetical protein